MFGRDCRPCRRATRQPLGKRRVHRPGIQHGIVKLHPLLFAAAIPTTFVAAGTLASATAAGVKAADQRERQQTLSKEADIPDQLECLLRNEMGR